MTAQITPMQVPLTSGAVRSFGHMRMDIAGMDFTGGFKSAKYSRKREREMPMSNSPDPVGKTLGENKYQCSVVAYYDWWMNLLLTVQNNLGPGYGDVLFTIYFSYVGVNLSPYQDVALGCSFDSTQADNATGIGALTREMEFNPVKIKFNGIDDLQNPLAPGP